MMRFFLDTEFIEDEMVEAVARIAPEPNGNGEHLVEMVLGGHRHCAWLSGSPRLIAALAEVFARDAKVREMWPVVDRLEDLLAGETNTDVTTLKRENEDLTEELDALLNEK